MVCGINPVLQLLDIYFDNNRTETGKERISPHECIVKVAKCRKNMQKVFNRIENAGISFLLFGIVS